VLAAPPGDGLRVAREHFTEYVKPILVAAAMDWDVIEGRREGDVRAGVAERIRRKRRKQGEFADTSIEIDVATANEMTRARTGVQDYTGVKGDIVIGRHTWKEYVRGVHEGWLGPIDPPKAVVDFESTATITEPQNSVPDLSLEARPEQPVEDSPRQETLSLDDALPVRDDGSPTAAVEPAQEKPKEEPEKPKRAPVPSPHITTDLYSASRLAPSIPRELEAAVPISFVHILGFLKTPIRIYRFLNRRSVADDIGRQTAAAVLAAHRAWQEDSGAGDSDDTAGNAVVPTRHWEQQDVLIDEEKYWHKSARERKEGEKERVWLDDIVVDPRIGQRMRKFEMEAWEEERARAIWKGAKGLPGRRDSDELTKDDD